MATLSSVAAQWSTIDRLLDEALALPPAERGGWLAALDPEAAPHRALLLTLLQTQAGIETDDFLDHLRPLQHSPSSGALADVPTTTDGEPHPGKHVGTYRLLHELGRGGMGVVWLAERADGLARRPVALKLPRIAWTNAFAERLVREREILASLEHRHIARLYDAGADAHGRPFIAMQYVEGEPIDRYCAEHALDVPARIALLLQVMSAVAHAHARLVVHRDLKPGNILVDAEGQATLLDFGLAKLLEEGDARGGGVTELAGRALTPDYASPEQIRDEPLGTSTDVYSLGVIAYELLAGVKPYRLKRGSAAELEQAIIEVQPARASDVVAKPALRRALRGDIDAILNRALQKSAADRYPSVEAFAQDLQRQLRGEPVQARPDRLGYRLAKFIGRHRLGTAATAALIASVVAGVSVSVWQAQLAKQETKRALGQVSQQTAVRALYVDTLSLVSVLAQEHPEALSRPGAVTSVMLDRLRELAPIYANDPSGRSGQFQSAILQLNYANRYDDTIALATEYLDFLRQTNGPVQEAMWAYSLLGRTLVRVDRFDEAEAARRTGAELALDSSDIEIESERVVLLADLGDILGKRGSRNEAVKALTRAEALSRRFPELADSGFIPLRGLGILHLGVNDDLALKYMQQADVALAGHPTGQSEEMAFTRWMLAEALLATGDAAKAESELTDVATHYRQKNGHNALQSLRSFGRLNAAVARRDPARASAMLDAESKLLAVLPTGLSPRADQLLTTRRLEIAWLTGDSSVAVTAVSEESRKAVPLVLDEPERLSVAASRLLILQGRANEALQHMQALRARLPPGDKPSVPWLVVTPALLEAQVAAGWPADAKRAADALLQFFEGEHAQGGHEYRTAAALGALATARAGDRDGAARLLARLAQAKLPPFPSAVERAQCELYRAQALAETGQGAAAAEVARAALPDLAGQNPSSPRLALARRLAEGG